MLRLLVALVVRRVHPNLSAFQRNVFIFIRSGEVVAQYAFDVVGLFLFLECLCLLGGLLQYVLHLCLACV